MTLTATADANNQFEGWTGCDSEPSGNCKVTMDEAKLVEAEFAPIPTEEFELEVEVTGNGDVDSSPAGILNCRESSGDCEDEYAEGTEVTLTATPDVGNQFEGWTGCDSEPSGNCKVTMDEAKLVEAEFAPIPTEEFELEVEVTGNGDVDSSPAGILNCRESSGDCSDEYTEGTEVTLTATADANNQFEGWTGCDSEPAANKCKVTIDEAKFVEAEFAPIERTLTVNTAGTGSGTVTCDGGECEASYPHGTEVTLAASADSGSTFAGWSGGGCSGTGSCEVTLTADTTVTATFNVSGGGGGDGGGGTTPPPPPPPSEAAGVAQVGGSAVVKAGKALLKLTCKGGPCKGLVKLFAKLPGSKKSVLIGKASFSIAAGAKKTVKVKITNGKAKKLFKQGKTLRAQAKGTGVKTRSVKLKPAK